MYPMVKRSAHLAICQAQRPTPATRRPPPSNSVGYAVNSGGGSSPNQTDFALWPIAAANAGKMATISLYDLADLPGNPAIEFIDPTSGSPATFAYAPIVGNQASPRISLQTAVNGSAYFNNLWATFSIALPSYGYAGGTWKLRYQTVGAFTDHLTSSVSIQ
jgi:hypothetical protein